MKHLFITSILVSILSFFSCSSKHELTDQQKIVGTWIFTQKKDISQNNNSIVEVLNRTNTITFYSNTKLESNYGEFSIFTWYELGTGIIVLHHSEEVTGQVSYYFEDDNTLVIQTKTYRFWLIRS